MLGENEYFSDYGTTRTFSGRQSKAALRDAWAKYLRRFPNADSTESASESGEDFADLPPGWKLVVNASGDYEYASEYASTRPFRKAPSRSGLDQAWQKYRRHTSKNERPELARDGQPPDTFPNPSACPPNDAGAFGSLTKFLHRTRFLEHLRVEACSAVEPVPSAAFIASPDLADALFFQSAVDDGRLPANTRLDAINFGSFDERSRALLLAKGKGGRKNNVELYPNTSMEDHVERAGHNEFSVVWMDLVKSSFTYKELSDACNAARRCVMLTLSLSRKDASATERIVEAVADAMGVAVSHVEKYRGLSGIRNMAFFELDCSSYKARPYDKRYEDIGKLIYIAPAALTRARLSHDRVFTLVCRGVRMHMCFCVGFSPETKQYLVLPYDEDRHPKTEPKDRILVDADEVYWTAPLDRRYEAGVC